MSKVRSIVTEPYILAEMEKSVSTLQSQKTTYDCLKVPWQWVFQIQLGEMCIWIP